MAKAIDPQSSMAALFGSRLRKLRIAAGLTQAEVGVLAHVVSSRIAQLERATGAKPTLELTRVLDKELVADELLIDLWPYVYREAFPDWSRAFIAYSARAAVIREYASHAVPGLLQTPQYARALLSVGHTLRDDEHLEERLAARLDRQVRLTGPDRPELWIILDEAVLRRPVGGAAVMRGQLEKLLRMAEEPNVTIQVLPFDQGAHGSLGGSLTVLVMPDGTEVAYTEGAHYGQLTEEPDEVERFVLTYDQLRAMALPPLMSLALIRSVLEADYRAASVPSRSDRRRLAQQQLQQPGGRQLRTGGGRIPRRRPRP
ncbi:Scr1 family TA system antitoxin-like transcriptional regulator [Streptomyces anulatus]|uniref:helix-turn-helix domain-containing protein n=1 Tax=Streptomyces TaxID=1883 RepID=UPI00211D5C3B|nr:MULTISPECIES: helix-turn-helix transcriptional regulator [Streptomyces]MCX4518832.1 helix-turn-helix transcriptional regulator [Streptomyces anulatus]MCX4601713.1 helix-turn-helix transcriptional regulator [Streptomyces anulatus]WSU74088.1 helix-turn-helix transcriptional regulator [Streptomyces anulatus]WTD10343.1 helix-turn-helix transcriptional regulator [Streptomyces anulatus]WTE03648.1 helix-turn-helix transcriptional regulator [Streptomyces anulatus]